MGRKIRTYSRVAEASEMIGTLCDRYPEAFWCVRPETIAVMGIDNVERSEKAVAKQPIWSRMRHVKGVEKAIFNENDIKESHIIEVHWADWNMWKESIRAAVLAQHLFEITPDDEVKNGPDCVGFKILYNVLGVNWEKDNGSGIPNLLTSDVKFDLDLRPGLDLEEDNPPEEEGGKEDSEEI